LSLILRYMISRHLCVCDVCVGGGGDQREPGAAAAVPAGAGRAGGACRGPRQDPLLQDLLHQVRTLPPV